MSNIKLIDNYLTNRLSDEEKNAFELQLANDSNLRADLAVQKQIIEGVRKARATELKKLLKQVTIEPPLMHSMPILRIAASVVGVGIIIAALSYYFNSNHDTSRMATSLEGSIKKQKPTEFEPLEEPHTPSTDPQQNDTSELGPQYSNTSIARSHIYVEVEKLNKKYSFHYQLTQGKLFLYGSFTNGGYEIWETNDESRTLFLSYKENFYTLDESKNTIKILEPIRNTVLINVLREQTNK